MPPGELSLKFPTIKFTTETFCEKFFQIMLTKKNSAGFYISNS